MLQRTEGLVVKTVDFGEADRIVTFLTQDFGLVKAFAKSSRKTKSRFGSSLEPLTCSRIAFWGKEDSQLPRLTQSDILHPFESLRSSLDRFLPVAELIEITLHLLLDHDGKSMYPVLLDTLHSYERHEESSLLSLAYKVRLLAKTGYLPAIDRCGRCGKQGDAFHLAHGTILCKGCAGEAVTTMRVSPAMVGLSRTLMAWDISKLSRIRPQAVTVRELSELVDAHLRFTTDKRPKAVEFRTVSRA